jgi:GrpB-like predicted nucleotidyltransferase (UPF0157 family)
MLGLPKGIVKLEPHSKLWRRLFAEEAARICEAVGEYVLAIEHVGSTSIEGIAAKPIIDMAIAVENLAKGERCIAPLENIGYEYRGEHGIAGRFYFVKGEPRTHHLHLVLATSDFWRSHLLFRDYLRENPSVAEEPERLKIDLAEKFPDDRDSYLESKGVFIEKVLRIAGFSV